MHAEDGVDFLTNPLWKSTKETAHKFKRNKRLTNIVSRGCSIIFAWMENDRQRKSRFMNILMSCWISAGNMMFLSALGMPAAREALPTEQTPCQIEELIALGELAKRAWKRRTGYDRRAGTHAA